MKDPSFSFKDFAKWLEQSPDSRIKIIDEDRISPGDQVLIRLSEKNMIKKLSEMNKNLDSQTIKVLSENLKENGGIVKEIKGSDAKIRVLGSKEKISEVFIQRLFLRRPKK
jgi:hypothetical protein